MKSRDNVFSKVQPSHTFLHTVKSYLNLVNGRNTLVPGSGIKRLYVMSSGLTTFNTADIDAVVAKAIRTKVLPTDMRGFMNRSIAKNMALYGQELYSLIAERICDISSGEVHNNDSQIALNTDRARRSFYTIPVTFLTRVKTVLRTYCQDSSYYVGASRPFESCRTDAELILSQVQGQEGFNSPAETSWIATLHITEGLVSILQSNAEYLGHEAIYGKTSFDALTILWIISKLLLGDLTTNLQHREINKIDLDNTYKLTDGTLAAIPFPSPNTVEEFYDEEAQGVSMLGENYLSAVSAAVFYRRQMVD